MRMGFIVPVWLAPPKEVHLGGLGYLREYGLHSHWLVIVLDPSCSLVLAAYSEWMRASGQDPNCDDSEAQWIVSRSNALGSVIR